jgi:hypothetical protein
VLNISRYRGYDEGMASTAHKLGWIAQALIVSLGCIIGAFFGSVLAGPDMGVGGPEVYRIQAWCILSTGAIAGGWLFSWAKDK